MKVAVLVLAYRYPLGLRALTRLLPVDFDVFVHVDKKVDILPFVESSGASAHFLDDRVTVFWRGWSMVEATMQLILHAKEAYDYDRYLLISDDSIPTVGSAKIIDALSTQPNWIQIHPANNRAWRYEKFFMFDSYSTQLRWIEDREVTDDALARFARLAGLRRRGKKPITTHYQGSQWWALSADSIDLVIQAWQEDTWLRESFEFSDAPDEGYFQTILAPTCEASSRALMLVDWHPPVAPPPRIFKGCEELLQIRPTTELFARKIDFDAPEMDRWIKLLESM